MAKENTKELDIKIEGKKWQEAIDQAYEKKSKEVKIDGFRKGKAPKDMFLKKYGEEALFMDAADIALQDAYEKALKENKDLEIVTQPQISLNSIDKKGVSFKIVFVLKPEIKLGKYKGLGVKKEKVTVSKEEIKKAIDTMLNRYAELIVKDTEIENGDTAIIDFEGFKDNVAFDGGKGEDYSLEIGSNTFIPGFEDQLIGLKKGDKKDIKLSFPEDYPSEDLKGAAVVFKIEVKEVKTKQIPELTKEFYEDLGLPGITDEKAFETEIKSNLLVGKEKEAENKYLDELLDAAVKNVKVEVPEVMIDDEIHRMMHQYEDNLKMQGLTLEQFYQFTNSDEQALKDQMQDEAINRIKIRLMLEEIAKVEEIKITEADAKKEAKAMAEKYQMELDEFLKAFGGLEMIQYDLKMRKAIDTLKDEK